MNHVYNQYQRQTMQLERDLRPVLKSDSFQSRQLALQIRGLQSDFAAKKDPRAIESRMKGIQQQVGMMERLGNHLSDNHYNSLHQNMTAMRTGIKSLPQFYKK